MSDFLQLEGKTIVVFGVANKKSVAWHIGKTLEEAGATVVYIVRSQNRFETLTSKLLKGRPVFICDVEFEDQISTVSQQVIAEYPHIHGLVHSIAFADYEGGIKPFHATGKKQFLRTMDISCYSFMAISNAFKDALCDDASVVTISISTTTMASENYGFMAPAKAALDSSLAFLAKSFSKFSQIRFNAVAPGLLKTSASAGIPGYVDAFLFAEKVIPRGVAVSTQEVANTACFLLSPRSAGINSQRIVIDAGMAINYFDNAIIGKVMDNS